MRNLLTLLILLFAVNAFAQQYAPFPTSNTALWNFYAERNLDNGNYRIRQNEQYMVTGDTLIAGNLYKKIMLRRHVYDTVLWSAPTIPTPNNSSLAATVQDVYYGAYRESNKMIYQYMKDSLSEALKYDFNSIGSQATSIDSVLVGNQYRRRYIGPNMFHVIEGIGWPHNFIGTIWQGEETVRFLCFVDMGNFYLNSSVCTYIFPYGTPTSVAGTQQEVAVQVFPNPFDNTLTIAAEKGTASLYNSIGALVAQLPITGKQTAINTAQLAGGVYFLVVKDENGNLLHRQQVVK